MATAREGLGLAVLAALALVATACGPVAEGQETAQPVAAPPPEQLVLLDFDDGATPVGAILPTVPNSGTAVVHDELVTVGGGRVRRVEGLDGGYAARFPAFDEGDPAGALLLLRPLGERDVLSPGNADFGLGADVMLDAQTASHDEASTDVGDIVLQRGFALDPVQLKLQVDGGRPSCRVAGAGGEAVAKADATLDPDRWYRVACERRGDELTIRWQALDDAEDPGTTTTVTARTGSVDFPRGVPMTVGGKSDQDGRAVLSSSDQFNGALDNVWFDVLDGSLDVSDGG
jgi:hypothetical protein